METPQAFSFGKNWSEFLKSITEEKLQIAEASIKSFIGVESLAGKSFIDIGCGSGIFSTAAFHMGASKIVSFDVDAFSVQCCELMHEKVNKPSNWSVHQGSVLDKHFISKFGTFDIVYSWGVLHHTGDMWAAIRNAAELVNPGGYYYIALYNNVGGIFGSRWWHHIKEIYNRHPYFGKYVLESLYVMRSFFLNFFRLRSFIKNIYNYKRKRGMSWRRDISDWVGGYPYEYATVEEVFSFMKKNFPDFRLVNVKSTNGLGNNWFLFQKSL